MERLLQWAILNSATEGEDAPNRPSTTPAAPRRDLDPAVIDHILGKDDSVRMREAFATIQDPTIDLDTKESAFEDLELLVGQIDNANNLVPLGLWESLLTLLRDPEPVIRSNAAWICGTAIQNNPTGQAHFQQIDGLASIMPLLQDAASQLAQFPGTAAESTSATEDQRAREITEVQSKALFCISAYIRQFSPGLQDFIGRHGLTRLQAALRDNPNGPGAYKLRRRIYFLLFSLAQVPEYQPAFNQRLVKEGYVDLLADQIANLLAHSEETDTLVNALQLLVGLHAEANPAVANEQQQPPEGTPGLAEYGVPQVTPTSTPVVVLPQLADTLRKYPGLVEVIRTLQGSTSDRDLVPEETWKVVSSAMAQL
ncbi:hsp70 nucleotide exchange factor fes1 [Tieghemiomyces parasiticus]|uniref:Hsp70 nucleotide exchange factor fes1 n=1 Tax=Tieghemiomyces parasiticus TaxID=78921 RepID=A0A9W7ZLU7_9FUNG|nr:hsp70 nucleotide exchange factor fes1 [Tieghemiomyces parasiticus]